MKIPSPIESILIRDRKLQGLVLTTIQNFEDWFSGSNTVFFQNYTKHDIGHIEAVLKTCADLIKDTAYAILTPSDVAILTLGCLLHDSALHLTEESFQALVSDKCLLSPIPKLDDRSWLRLWNEFLADAQRFDGPTLERLFGDSSPVTAPPDKIADWTERHRKLIGEFIRRNHTALAHQFAIHGVPGADGRSFELIAHGFDFRMADLAGLVARSHGHGLRDMFPYLKERFHERDFNGIHAVYLMVLLRIADYLQIQPERAPEAHLKLHRLRSPFSDVEWRVHQATQNITYADTDPEAIYVDSRPSDVKTYLRVCDWLDGVQHELDHSWAVLGEVYGRYDDPGFPLSDLQVRLRRVRSNIDDKSAFTNQVEYLPRKVIFDSSGSDLLKLLIGPLYNFEHYVGIRELIQNASDSVREMTEIERRGSVAKVPRTSADIEIEAKFDHAGNPTEFCIRDYGTGMDENILTNYYLKAGASFRSSTAWQRAFQNEDGKSVITRSGRFGVGALAAFLIGPTLNVVTRHHASAYGLCFTASIDDQSIEIRKTICPVGTTICIPISEAARVDVKKFLDAAKKPEIGVKDIFLLGWPTLSVIETIPNEPAKSVRSTKKNAVPSERDGFNYPWRKTSTSEFESIHWSYKGAFPPIVNGLAIGNSDLGHPSRIKSASYGDTYFETPYVAITDKSGALSLNLARTQVSEWHPQLLKALDLSIARDTLAYALMAVPLFFGGAIRGESLRHTSDWVLTKAGFAPSFCDGIAEFAPDRIWAVPFDFQFAEKIIKSHHFSGRDMLIFNRPAGHRWSAVNDVREAHFSGKGRTFLSGGIWRKFVKPVQAALYIHEDLVVHLNGKSNKGLAKYLRGYLAEGRGIGSNINFIGRDGYPESQDFVREISEILRPKIRRGEDVLPMISIHQVKFDPAEKHLSGHQTGANMQTLRADRDIYAEWKRLLGTWLVPYSAKARSEVSAITAIDLVDHIQHWKEAMRRDKAWLLSRCEKDGFLRSILLNTSIETWLSEV